MLNRFLMNLKCNKVLINEKSMHLLLSSILGTCRALELESRFRKSGENWKSVSTDRVEDADRGDM